MILKDIPDKLYGPEYYMEQEGKDVRLTVMKINDFIETLGDAKLSLIYSDKDEHSGKDKFLINIIRRIHIRHSIVDLNNSFDILLQIPWFLYRVWNEYNTGGLYCSKKQKPTDDIIRNTPGWIDKIENSCSFKKLLDYLKGSTDANLNSLATLYEDFNNDFRFNPNKSIVIREVANQLKHKHNIKLEEFYEPYNFNIEVNGQTVNLKENNLSSEIKAEFYEQGSGTTLGQIITKYEDDLEVNIEYYSGEKFFGSDLISQQSQYSFDTLLAEMENYHNNITDLYNKIYSIIKDELCINPVMKIPTTRKTTTYNMDEYFKVQ